MQHVFGAKANWEAVLYKKQYYYWVKMKQSYPNTSVTIGGGGEISLSSLSLLTHIHQPLISTLDAESHFPE